MYMKEPYVSFKIAKFLKEKGFDWFTFGYYTMDDYDSPPYFGIENLCADNWNGEVDEVNDLWFSAPTQQMACYWVEKTYGFFIEISRSIDINGNYHYFYMILDKTCKYASSATRDNDYSSKSDAIESALEYVLTNLI